VELTDSLGAVSTFQTTLAFVSGGAKGKEVEKKKPEPYIKSVSSSGEVRVRWNMPMDTTVNLAEIRKEKVIVDNEKVDAFEVLVKPGEMTVQTSFNFNWEFKKWD
jgi:hypothetical protein